MLIGMRNGMLAGGGLSAKSYVQGGLVAMWDGSENAGWGKHEAAATRWTDLTGNGNDIVNVRLTSQQYWEDNAYYNSRDIAGLKDGLGYMPSNGLILDTFAPSDGHRTFEFCIIPYTHMLTTYVHAATAYGYTSKPIISGWQGVSQRIVLPTGAAGGWTWTIPDGSVWHMSVIRTGGSLITDFYKDGVFAKRVSGNVWRPTEDCPMILGCASSGDRHDVCGKCKYYALRIYNRALSAEEIAHNYAVDKARFNLE